MAKAKKNEAKEILMKRDGLTEKEATEVMAEALDEIGRGNYDALFDIGLEDDYIFDFLI